VFALREARFCKGGVMKKYHSLEDAEKLSGISVAMIERAFREDLVEYVSSDGAILIAPEEVERWISKDASLAERIEKKEKFPIRKTSYISHNKYILPFNGIFLVGGKHLQFCTRYAWDFVVIDRADFYKVRRGMTDDEMLSLNMKRGIKGNPEDFLCYEKEIIAQADGKIISVPEPVKFKNENTDGQGHIVIDHGHGEYSRLCHILGRTVMVKKGDEVRRGELLCLAGGKHGDGITQVSHLHWDVWDHTHFLFARGVPVKISKALVHNDGRVKKRYGFYLQRGMLVSNI